MTRNRFLFSVVLLVLASTLVTGCARKKPATAPVEAPVSIVEPTAPEASPAPVDPVESPLSGDLLAANEYAYANGLLGDVYFDFDIATLREDARERLSRNAEFLRSHPEFVVQIQGHCDERGTNDYNLALGERRARAAYDYLVQLGVSAARLRSLSYGEERPLCTASDESCWQRNRRAHFLLIERTN